MTAHPYHIFNFNFKDLQMLKVSNLNLLYFHIKNKNSTNMTRNNSGRHWQISPRDKHSGIFLFHHKINTHLIHIGLDPQHESLMTNIRARDIQEIKPVSWNQTTKINVCKISCKMFLPTYMLRWMTRNFMPFSSVFQTCQDNRWMIMKGCVQWKPHLWFKRPPPQTGSNLGPPNQ